MSQSKRAQNDAASKALKAAIRAYALGHLSATAPRLFRIIVKTVNRSLTPSKAADQILLLFSQQSATNRFPTFCGIVVGGTLSLRTVFRTWLLLLAQKSRLGNSYLSAAVVERLSKFLSSFAASLLAIWLLNRPSKYTNRGKPIPLEEISRPQIVRMNSARRRSSVRLSSGQNGIVIRAVPPQDPPAIATMAGKTLTLTSFACIRALEVLVRWAWRVRKVNAVRHNPKSGKISIMRAAEKAADPAVFIISCYVVMWAWFYHSERLPRAYNNWISSAAQLDPRLLETLREARRGYFVYGKDTGMTTLLTTLCQDLNMPEEWADPVKTIPIPCELYHCGAGVNCEWHAVVRFARAWGFAMRMYLPLNLFVLWRVRPWGKAVSQFFLSAARSSTFLGAFVTLFYYGVCLGRTRIGAKLFSRETITPLMWDKGLAVGVGCVLCGWSILLEKVSRRQELAFFVAPRALATILPQRYDRKHVWREELVFAASTAVVLTAVQENSRNVRGVLGRVLQNVLS